MIGKGLTVFLTAALAGGTAALAQSEADRLYDEGMLLYRPGPVTPMPKGAQRLAEDELVGRTVITRSGVRVGPVEQVLGGTSVQVREWWFSPDFGVLAIERFGGSGITIPLEFLEPYGRDYLLLATSRDSLGRKPGVSD